MAARRDEGAYESVPRLTLSAPERVPPSVTPDPGAAAPRAAPDPGAAAPRAAPAHAGAAPGAGGEPPFDLFVVHAEADDWFVRGYLLPALGLPDERVLHAGKFEPGAPLVAEIARGVSRSRLTLAVLSPAYLADRWAALGERLAAHARADDEGLVPLLLEPCAPPLAVGALVAVDFCDRSRWDEEVERLRRRLRAPAPAPAEAAPACPYPGMRPFGEQDQYAFFGRDREIEELHGRLHAGEREIYVIGPSGSGKSSLVTAGLVPSVHATAGLFHPPFLTRLLRPGERPTDRLSDALGGAADAPGPTLDALLAGRPTAGRVLLLVDQLEEIFTLAKPAERRRFFAALRGLRADPRCAFVFALRADFYGALMDSELWGDLKGQLSRLDVAPLHDEALAAAIERPARKAGVFLEPELVERLIADAAHEPGALPLLQEALVLLWQKRRQRSLLLSSYRALGERGKSGLAVALSRRADVALRALSPPQQAIAKRMLLRLVSFGEGRADTRRQQPWGALLQTADDREEAEAVLRRLTDGSARLLTASGGRDDVRVDLSHEAILTAWPTLQEWIRARRADEERRRAFEAKVREWVKRGRGKSGLLDPVQLAEAAQWRDSDAARELKYDRDLPALIEASGRHHRKQRRLARAAATGVALLTFGIWWVSLVALGQEREADAKRLEARALLAASYKEQGRQLLLRGQPLSAMPYLVEARRQGLDDVPLRSLFAEASRNLWLAQLRHGKAGVKSVAFGPDGARVVSAGDDGTARVWDVASGASLALAHQDAVNVAAFSPDGARVATASDDGTARVWDAASGAGVTPFLRHDASVVSVAFSPDGARLLTTSAGPLVRVWEASSGALVASIEAKKGSLAAFSADGARVITTRAGKHQVWDASSGALLFARRPARRGAPAEAPPAPAPASGGGGAGANGAPKGRPRRPASTRSDSATALSVSPIGSHFATVGEGVARVWSAASDAEPVATLGNLRLQNNVVFSPDGTRAVTTSWDRNARVWEAAGGTQLGAALDHRDVISAVAFSPDGERIVTASADKTARVWDAFGHPLTLPLEHQRKVTGAAFSPDGARVVTASEDGVIRVWDASGRALAAPLGRGQRVTKAVFSPDGGRVATAGRDATARVWGASDGKFLLPPLRHGGAVSDVAFAPDGVRLLTAGPDQGLRTWEASSGAPLGGPLGPGERASSLAVNADGTRLATISGEQSVRVWHAATLAPLSPPIVPGGRVRHAALSPDGARLLTAGDDKAARIWEAASGRPVGPPLRHKKEVSVAVFSPDGARALTAGKDRVARVWEAASGSLLASLQHEDNVNSAAFSPDGARIVTASTDTTARVWDAATGAELAPHLPHDKSVSSASFSPDGTRIITASTDQKVRLWEAATGKLLAVVVAHEGRLSSAAFSPDGARILTVVHEDAAHVWDVGPDDGSLAHWSALAARCSAYVLVGASLVPNPTGSPACLLEPKAPSAADAASRASNLLHHGRSLLRHQRPLARAHLLGSLELARAAGDEPAARSASHSLALLAALEGDRAGARAAWGDDAPPDDAALLRALAGFAGRELHQPDLARGLLRQALEAPAPGPDLLFDWAENLLVSGRDDEFAAAAARAARADATPARRIALDALSLAARPRASAPGPDVSRRLWRDYESLPEGGALGVSFEATRHALRYGSLTPPRAGLLLELLDELEKPVSAKVKEAVRGLTLALAKPEPDPDAPASPAPPAPAR